VYLLGNKKNECSDPIYHYLDDFVGNEVTLTLYNGQVLSGELVDLTNCLIVLRETEVLSPFIGQSLTIVRAKDVMIATVQPEFKFESSSSSS
jgi:small nuclear ribonucleoprotein (snRNP)-like protein